MSVASGYDIAVALAILGAGGREIHLSAAGGILTIFSLDGFPSLSTKSMEVLQTLGWAWDPLLDYPGGTGCWKRIEVIRD